MPLVSRWGSKVTTVPAREPKANSPRPTTLPSRPIAVDLEPTVKSLGAQVGAPIPVKDFSIIPQAPAPAPEPPAPEIVAPVSGPSDLTASKVKYAVRLNEAGARIQLGTSDIFNFSDQPFTLSIWAKMPEEVFTDEEYNIQLFDYGTTDFLSFSATVARTSTGPRVLFTILDLDHEASIGRNNEASGLVANEWAHFIFTYDGSKSSEGIGIWINGTSLLFNPASAGTYSGMYSGIFDTTDRQLSVGRLYERFSLSPVPDCEFFVDNIAIFDYELSNIEASELYTNGIYNISPIAYYSCGDVENGLGTSVRNLISNDPLYTGTLIGDATFVQDGAPDLIASEDLNNSLYSLKIGPTGRVDLGNPGVFQFENQSTQDDLTLSAWIKLAGAPMDDPDYDFTVFDYRDDVQRGFGARISGGETFQFSTTQPKISFYIFSNIGPGDDEEGIIATAQGVENVPAQNEWSHVMFSFDSTASNPEDGIKIWLDGRELPLSFHHSGPFTGIYKSNTCQLSVGAQPLSPYANSSGTVNVDDIAIFDYELSNIDASGLYNNGWSVLPNLMPIAYYSCGDAEDGLGNTVTNLESNNPDYVGALIGDATFVQDGAPNGYTK